LCPALFSVICLIQSAYRQEVESLTVWGSHNNNQELNTHKTAEMDFRRKRNTPALPPLTIMNSTVEAVVIQVSGHYHLTEVVQGLHNEKGPGPVCQLRKFNHGGTGPSRKLIGPPVCPHPSTCLSLKISNHYLSACNRIIHESTSRCFSKPHSKLIYFYSLFFKERRCVFTLLFVFDFVYR